MQLVDGAAQQRVASVQSARHRQRAAVAAAPQPLRHQRARSQQRKCKQDPGSAERRVEVAQRQLRGPYLYGLACSRAVQGISKRATGHAVQSEQAAGAAQELREKPRSSGR